MDLLQQWVKPGLSWQVPGSRRTEERGLIGNYLRLLIIPPNAPQHDLRIAGAEWEPPPEYLTVMLDLRQRCMLSLSHRSS